MKNTFFTSLLVFSTLFLLSSPIRTLLSPKISIIVQLLLCFLVTSLLIRFEAKFNIYSRLEQLSLTKRVLMGISISLVGIFVNIMLSINR